LVIKESKEGGGKSGRELSPVGSNNDKAWQLYVGEEDGASGYKSEKGWKMPMKDCDNKVNRAWSSKIGGVGEFKISELTWGL